MVSKWVYRLVLTNQNGDLIKMDIIGKNFYEVMIKIEKWAMKNDVIIKFVHLEDDYGVWE